MGWGSHSPERSMTRAPTAPGVKAGSILSQPPQGMCIRAANRPHPTREGDSSSPPKSVFQEEKHELGAGKAGPRQSTQNQSDVTHGQLSISPRTSQLSSRLRGSRADPPFFPALGRADEMFCSITARVGPRFCEPRAARAASWGHILAAAPHLGSSCKLTGVKGLKAEQAPAAARSPAQ